MRIVEFCRRRILWLIPIGVCLLLIAPMAFTQRTFAPDWTDHVWIVWQQKLNIQDLGLPSYFIENKELGAFYPFFAFYGDEPLRARRAACDPAGVDQRCDRPLYFAAFLAAYCGWTWLSIQAGLTAWPPTSRAPSPSPLRSRSPSPTAAETSRRRSPPR